MADQRSPRDGRVIETVGQYNPQTDPSTIVLKQERLEHWIAEGAQPTDSVLNLMKTQQIGRDGKLSAAAGAPPAAA